MNDMPRQRTLRLASWIILVAWLGYSGALLGWAAANSPSADICITR